MKENPGKGGNGQQEQLSLAELSRKYILGEISLGAYLILEKQLSPRFGFGETPIPYQPQTIQPEPEYEGMRISYPEWNPNQKDETIQGNQPIEYMQEQEKPNRPITTLNRPTNSSVSPFTIELGERLGLAEKLGRRIDKATVKVAKKGQEILACQCDSDEKIRCTI